jgi:hypothetical protein
MTKMLCKAAKKIQDICQHCDKIYYLKLKNFDGNFCSLDCKSTHIYLKYEIHNYINNTLTPDIK